MGTKMGWTFINRALSYQEQKAFIHEEIIGNGVAVQISKNGSNWYAAVKVKADDLTNNIWVPDETGYVVIGIVIMTSQRGGEFGYKVIGEECGPNYYGAPVSLINKLSDLDDTVEKDYVQWAANWRDQCFQEKERQKTNRSLKEGEKIILGSPVTVNGLSVDTFVVSSYYSRGKKKKAYYNPSVGLVRLMKRHLENFKYANA